MTHTDLEILADMVAARILAETRAASAPTRWLTVQAAADYCSTSQRTIHRWIQDGKVYAHKNTGSWRIDRLSIDQWFEEDRIS